MSLKCLTLICRPLTQTSKCLLQLLWRSIFLHLRSYKNPCWWESEAIENTLKFTQITWLFDGYDELPEPQQRNFFHLINRIHDGEGFAKHRCIITSRPQL